MNQQLRVSLTILFLLMAGKSMYAQRLVTGTVYDATSRSAVAFVSVTVKGSTAGTVTDIDGRFSLQNVSAEATLLLTHVGYKKSTVQLSAGMPMPLSIYIESAGSEMENVVILPGENPAHRIIRLLQQHKQQHDPDHIASFKYNAYTVSAVGGGEFIWNAQNNTAADNKKSESKPMVITDSVKAKKQAELMRRLKENYIFITESYTQRIFSYPGQSKETVLATKVSGIKSPVFAAISSNFQQFGFYQDYIQIGDKAYVNPVSNGSITMYKFRLKETRVNGSDTTFTISFEPQKGKNFNALKGMLYINSNGYAIENVTAAAADERSLFMRYKIQQMYENINGQWFPVQLNTTIRQTDVKTDSVLLYSDTKTYITNVMFNQQFSRKDFSDIKLDYDPRSGKRTAEEWNGFRKDSLGAKERATYETYEMLPRNAIGMLQKFNTIIEVLALQGIPYGKIDIPFKYLLSGINKYESFRLGGGFQTNPLFNKTFSLGAFAGYGIKDKAWKYGGNITLKLDERTATTMKLSYAQTIEEPGNTDYFIHNGSIFSSQVLRNFYTSRMDSTRQFRFDFGTKIKPWFQLNTWLLNEQRNPAGYDWEYKNTASNTTYRSFRNTEVGVGIRLINGEAFTKIGRAKIAFHPPKTQLLIQASRGLPNLLKGELSYTKLALQFNHSFRLKKLGQTIFQIEAGQIFGETPYSYLFNTKAGKINRSVGFFIPNTFQTVGLYEFAADRSASIFIQHNFGNLLFKPKNIHFRPEFSLEQAISFGSLKNAAYQTGIPLKTATKGLYETGLQIKNIYRTASQLFYLGIGGGVFYRYGPYQLPKTSDNIAFKIGLSLSF